MVLTVTQEMEEVEDVGSGGRGGGGWLNRVSMDIRQVTLKGLVHSIKHWMHLRGRHKMGVYKKKRVWLLILPGPIIHSHSGTDGAT